MPKPLAIALVFAALILLVAIGMVIFVPLTISQLQLLATQSAVLRVERKRGSPRPKAI